MKKKEEKKKKTKKKEDEEEVGRDAEGEIKRSRRQGWRKQETAEA